MTIQTENLGTYRQTDILQTDTMLLSIIVAVLSAVQLSTAITVRPCRGSEVTGWDVRAPDVLILKPGANIDFSMMIDTGRHEITNGVEMGFKLEREVWWGLKVEIPVSSFGISSPRRISCSKLTRFTGLPCPARPGRYRVQFNYQIPRDMQFNFPSSLISGTYYFTGWVKVNGYKVGCAEIQGKVQM